MAKSDLYIIGGIGVAALGLLWLATRGGTAITPNGTSATLPIAAGAAYSPAAYNIPALNIPETAGNVFNTILNLGALPAAGSPASTDGVGSPCGCPAGTAGTNAYGSAADQAAGLVHSGYDLSKLSAATQSAADNVYKAWSMGAGGGGYNAVDYSYGENSVAARQYRTAYNGYQAAFATAFLAGRPQ